jgi:hypothetical protein
MVVYKEVNVTLLVERCYTLASLHRTQELGKVFFLSVEASFNPLKPSGHYVYNKFDIHKFCFLPTRCIYVFCVDLRTNSDYFSIQH